MCVVVSCYDRAALLPQLVAALRAQTHRDFEARLVDNGSTDDTRRVLADLTADDARFHVLHVDDNRGPARARNLAWRSTDAPWVAFTDDDCIPEPDWLANLLAAARDADIVQGRTVPIHPPPTTTPGWFDRSQNITRWSGRYQTCNLLVGRRWLDQLDGFDETFRIAMGEDTDFGLRAVDRGATTAYADDAVVGHHVWPSGFREFLEQRRRWGEYVELMRVNPQARELLRWGYVARGVHLVVWGLVPLTAASLVWGVPWVPPLVVLAWAGLNTWRTRHRPWSTARRLGYSTLQFVGYAYETVWFAVSSVRYRSLVI